jgi:ABC-2 type transport system permease protein
MVMKQTKKRDITRFVLVLAILVLLNFIGGLKFFRLDLTSEKRYSLSPSTKALMEKVDDRIYAKVYLEGDLPSGFQRLQRETQQMLTELRAYNRNLEFEFINPAESDDEKINEEVAQQLQYKGLRPVKVQVGEKTGSKNLRLFPGAIFSLGDKEIAVPLLLDQFASSSQAQINASVQNLEYSLANAIKRLTTTRKPSVAFLQGHGELQPQYVVDFARTLSENYQVNKFDLRNFKADSVDQTISVKEQQIRLNRFDALIIAKPTQAFSDLDKYLLDQFIMSGGKVLWCIDAVHAEIDSLSKASQFLAYPRLNQLKLDDMLFKYGVRINTDLVMDMVAAGLNDQKQIRPWVYWPLIMPQIKHPIAKDLNAVKLEFASSLDTIIAPGVDKTFLLRSSPYSRTAQTPHMVSLNEYYKEQDERMFPRSAIPVAVLLEGEFESVYKNRIQPKDDASEQLKVIEKSAKTQMVVVADGDVIKNQLNLVDPNIERNFPLPLGYDQFTGQQYGNKDFLLNAIDYMLDDSGLISIRSRELKIRLLDFNKLKDKRMYWQLINTLVPIGLMLLFALVYTFIRKKKYT